MDNALIYKTTNSQLEIKQDGSDGKEFIHLEGFASTFGNMDRDGDIIVKGAFTKTLTDADIKVKLLNQHNIQQPIGAIDQLTEVDEGLFFKGRLPLANSIVKDMHPLLQMGVLGDVSIGFQVVDADITPDGNRLIKEIKLFEISIVTIPANPKARITSVKADENMLSLDDVEGITTKREFEQVLLGTKCFSRKAAIVLASRFNEDVKPRDSVDPSTKQSDSVSTKAALEEFAKFKQLLNGV